MSRRTSSLAVAALLGVAATAATAASPFRFEDATEASGIDYVNRCGAAPGSKGWLTEAMGQGAAWLDYDGDGNLDLYVVNGSDYARWPKSGEPNRLYRGDGKGRFEDVTDAAGVGDRGWGYGVAAADFDNDGDPDLYVTNLGKNRLFRNDGDGTFSEVGEKAGVADDRWGVSAAWVDLDDDGLLDLYVGNYMECDTGVVPRRGVDESGSVYCTYKGLDVYCGPLGQVAQQDVVFRNRGDGTFEDVTRKFGFHLEKPRYSLGVVTGDYDNDGKVDLYVANDSMVNSLWKNHGGGEFRDSGMMTMVALNADGRAQAGMGTDFGDVNGDGYLDIAVTNFAHDLNTVYINHGGKFFTDDSATIGMGVTGMALSWGTGFHDFDGDGDLDLFIANGHIYPQVDDVSLGTTYRQRNHVFDNRGDRLVEVSAESGPGLAVTRSFRGAAFADYDDDGDMDALVVAMDEPALLLRNAGTGHGHWLRVALDGKKSNRDGIGARIVVEAGGRRLRRDRKGGGSFLSTHDPRVHFGLGNAKKVARIDVFWPGGTHDVLRDVEADRTVTVVEGSHPAPPE